MPKTSETASASNLLSATARSKAQTARIRGLVAVQTNLPPLDSLSPTQEAKAETPSTTRRREPADQSRARYRRRPQPLADTMLRRGCSGAVLAAAVLLAAAAAAAVPGAAGFHLGGDESVLVRGMLAAIREQAEAEDAARFAVAEHNKNQGAALEFARVVQAKRQVVAGTLHDLMLEVVDAGKKSLYSAKVWVKPWQDFKAVVEFRHVGDSHTQSSISSDGSPGQATADISLEVQVAPRTQLHSTKNNGISVDSPSSSQAYSV